MSSSSLDGDDRISAHPSSTLEPRQDTTNRVNASAHRDNAPTADGEANSHITERAAAAGGPEDERHVRFDVALVFARAHSSSFEGHAPNAPSRDVLVRRLRAIGLGVRELAAIDALNEHKHLLLIGATGAWLELAAERARLRLRLRAEYGGGYAAFTRERAHMFVPARADGGAASALLHSAQRAALVERALGAPRHEEGAEVDLAALRRGGGFERQMRLHDPRERRGLEARVGEGSLIGADALPARRLRSYLGAEQSEYLALQHRMSRALWLPASVGVLLAALEAGVSASGAGVLTPLYSLLLLLWASAFVEGWRRREAALAAEAEAAEGAEAERGGGTRAEFVGELRRGLIAPATPTAPGGGAVADGGALAFAPVALSELPSGMLAPVVEVAPAGEAWRRAAGSAALVTLALGATCTCALALLALRVALTRAAGAAGMLGGAALNSAYVELVERLFARGAERLTAWENHRTHATHRAHLIAKLVAFSAVHRFFALFYVAFARGRGALLPGSGADADACVHWSAAGAAEGGCMDELRMQVLVLTLGRSLAALAIERAAPLWERRRACERDAADAARRAGLERRAACELRLRASEPVDGAMNALACDFATVALFATAFPLAPVLVLVNNFNSMRGAMLRSLRLRARPSAAAADEAAARAGASTWSHVLSSISYLAVVTNFAILAFTSRHLDAVVALSDSAKLILLIVIEHAVLLAKAAVAHALPRLRPALAAAIAKRQWLARAWAEDERPAYASVSGWVEEDAALRAEGIDLDLGADADGSDGSQADSAEAEDEGRAAAGGSCGGGGGAAAASLHAELLAPPDAPPDDEEHREGWTPFNALVARRAPRQCTDVLCVLLLLLTFGALVTLTTVGHVVGPLSALSAGRDTRFDLCGHALPAARLDARLLARDASTPPAAPVASAGADRTATPQLFLADPARHVGVCVRACPSPARAADGFEPSALVCTPECEGLEGEARAGALGTCCFPAYASTAVNGYCRPDDGVRATDLAAAWARAPLPAGARRSWPSDVELESVRELTASAGKGVGDAFADLARTWRLLVGCGVGAFVLGAALAARFERAPVSTVIAALVLAIVGGAVVTGALWAAGEREMREHYAEPDSPAYRNAHSVAVFGYMACVATAVGTFASFFASSTVVVRIGHATAEVREALGAVPALHALPALGALGTLCVLLWWFFTAAHLAASGELHLAAGTGFPLPTFDSALMRLLAAHALAGLLLLSLVQHVLRMAAAAVAASWYFRRSLPTAAPAAGGAKRGAAGEAADGSAERDDDEDSALALPPEPTARAALWFVCRYHLGSAVYGALVLPLTRPIRAVAWLFRPCRLGATPSAERGEPDPLSACCGTSGAADALFALSADAYAVVVAADLPLLTSALATWRHQLRQPNTCAAHTQQAADVCFFALKLAGGAIASAVAAAVLTSATVGMGQQLGASLLWPIAIAFVLGCAQPAASPLHPAQARTQAPLRCACTHRGRAHTARLRPPSIRHPRPERRYLAVSQFVLVHEAVLSALTACYMLDVLHNSAHALHASANMRHIFTPGRRPGWMAPAPARGGLQGRPAAAGWPLAGRSAKPGAPPEAGLAESAAATTLERDASAAGASSLASAASAVSAGYPREPTPPSPPPSLEPPAASLLKGRLFSAEPERRPEPEEPAHAAGAARPAEPPFAPPQEYPAASLAHHAGPYGQQASSGAEQHAGSEPAAAASLRGAEFYPPPQSRRHHAQRQQPPRLSPARGDDWQGDQGVPSPPAVVAESSTSSFYL